MGKQKLPENLCEVPHHIRQILCEADAETDSYAEDEIQDRADQYEHEDDDDNRRMLPFHQLRFRIQKTNQRIGDPCDDGPDDKRDKKDDQLRNEDDDRRNHQDRNQNI